MNQTMNTYRKIFTLSFVMSTILVLTGISRAFNMPEKPIFESRLKMFYAD